jgi:hypothetical protein
MLFDTDTGQPIAEPAEDAAQPQDFSSIAQSELAKARSMAMQSRGTPVQDMLNQSRPMSRLSQLQQFSRTASRSWQDNQIGQEEYYSGPMNTRGDRAGGILKIDRTGEKGEHYSAGGYELPDGDGEWETADMRDTGKLRGLGYSPFR